jgi:hypothetical protein
MLIWYLYRVTSMDLVSVFCRQIPSFPSNICRRGCLFSIISFWHLCENQVGVVAWIHICVLYFVPLVFISIFCASTMLFLSIWLCSIVWSQVLWYLQHCCFCSVLPWLFTVFCVSKWTLGLIFRFLLWMSLEFWWELGWTCRMLLVVRPFSVFWFCQFLSMRDLSTFFSLLQFLFSTVCSFPCRVIHILC